MSQINNNEKKFNCLGQILQKNQAEDSQEIESYTLEAILKNKVALQCEGIAQTLNSKGIATDFDNENSVRLTYKEITESLDNILYENQSVTRDSKIGCIVKIYASTIFRINHKMRRWKMFDMEKNGRTINIYNLKVDIDVATRFLEENFELERSGNIGVQFSILNVDNVKESEHINKFNITFSKTYTTKKSREILLPRPHTDLKSFRIWGRTQSDIDQKAQTLFEYLTFIYGRENVETTLLYDFAIPYEASGLEFSEQEWDEITQALMKLDFDAGTGFANENNGRYIFFEFENEEELKHRFSSIEKIGKFEIVKSPLEEDFKFKVKILSRDAAKDEQDFEDSIAQYDGKEFVCNDGNGNQIYIGRLMLNACNTHKMAFRIPYKTKSNQERAQQVLNYISKNQITEIMENPNPEPENEDDGWLQSIWSKVKESFS